MPQPLAIPEMTATLGGFEIADLGDHLAIYSPLGPTVTLPPLPVPPADTLAHSLLLIDVLAGVIREADMHV